MNTTNPKVDFYFNKPDPVDGSGVNWQKEIRKLRKIVLDCGVTEQLKWGVPTYTYENSNIVLIHVFKEYCAILFFKGALLKDPENILVQQTKNVQSARQMRFTSVEQIDDLEPTIKGYIKEAIQVEKAGLKVELKKTTEYSIPEEFKKKLKEMPALKKSFEALTPGRQRGYYLHFAAPKQSTTRASRIEKAVQRILDGKGLND